MADRKKIKLFQEHFAYLDSDFLLTFEKMTSTINIISFIKEQVYLDFGFYLESVEDLKKLDKMLEKNYYKDKSEWLREKMRDKMKSMDESDN